MFDKKAGAQGSRSRKISIALFITFALSFLAGRYEFPRHEESYIGTPSVVQQKTAKVRPVSRLSPAARRKTNFKRQVQKGETWSQIAASEFSGGSRPEVYTELAKAAGIKNPDKIFAGIMVSIPCAITVHGRSIHARNCAQGASQRGSVSSPRKIQAQKPADRSGKPYSTVLDNNPLNVTYGPSTSHWVIQGYATVKHHKGLPYLAFKTLEMGTQAASELLFTSRLYGTKTVAEAISVWSGHNYGPEILKGTTINSRVRVKDLGSTERSMLLYAMARREGGKLIRSP
jgi:hypothetical protein